MRVVLVRPTHPGNIGAAARAMWTMGIRRLTLVAPRRFPDSEAVALATGATEVLDCAEVVATLDQALAGCGLAIGLSARPREFAGRVLPLRDAAGLAAAEAERHEVALVFGTEMSGLSNEELSRCSVVATIPANPRYASLNLASAVQVACYETRLAATGGEVWRAPRFETATHDELEGLYSHAQRTLVAMRFLNPAMPRRLMPRLRRLFARAGLEREEVNILRGILARVDELLGRADGGKRSDTGITWYAALGRPMRGDAQRAAGDLLARLPTFARVELACVASADEALAAARAIEADGAWWDVEEQERERLWATAAARLGEDRLGAVAAAAEAEAREGLDAACANAPLDACPELAAAAREALLLAVHQAAIARAAGADDHWFGAKLAMFAAGHWVLGVHRGRLLLY